MVSHPLHIACVLVALVLAGCTTAPLDAGAAPTEDVDAPSAEPFGATRLLFHAPAPWFVEGIAVLGDRAFTGTAFGATGTPLPLLTMGQPSRIYVLDIHNETLLETILVQGEDTMAEHAVAGLTTDADGRLYAASTQLGILRFTETADGWNQETYATIPDLPMCTPLAPSPCSPTPDDQPGLPNDLTWDVDGNLYVSDSFQATVWRIPPGPSAPEIWYQHASLDRTFGPNGLRVDAERDRLILAVCCLDTFAAGPVDRASRLVTLPFPDPTGAEPTDLYVLDNLEGADGIELNETGAIYIASNFGTKILVVAPDGTLVSTITNDDLSGPATMDFPASLTFHDATRSLIITNYAYNDASAPGLPEDDQRTVFRLAVDDVGAAPIRPSVP